MTTKFEPKRHRQPVAPRNYTIAERFRGLWPEIDAKVETALTEEREHKSYLSRLDRRLKHHLSTLTPKQLRQFLEDDRPQIVKFHNAIYGELHRRRVASGSSEHRERKAA